ncbi:MAG TPA: nitrilase-related carbon-nitrogen hydrolase [Candidatus Acidoferrales bacterium]|nr:nitrilase-related carbon-nitrogen hydrolase [Candidatus Acidoferrales bacterium]
MVWFGNGLNPWWPLMWFAPLPVLIFASRSSSPTAAISAFLAWFAGSFTMWRYLHTTLGLSFVTFVSIFFVEAFVFTLGVLLFRALLRRGAPWSALLAFPALWVACEYAHNLFTPDGTAGSLSYTQLKFLPFLQLASVTGPWGLSFLLLLFSAALAIRLYLRRTAPRQGLRIVGTGVGIIVLVLIFGAFRLAMPMRDQRMRVGLIASDQPANVNVAIAGSQTDQLFREYVAAAESLAGRGAQVIVLPEKLGVVGPDSKTADSIFQSSADKTKVVIVVGMVAVSPPLKYNQARVYRAAAPVMRYDKEHMLPPFESKFKPGTTLTFMREASETWGVAICKDMDFTALSRKYGEAGAGLMLVPGWDFVIDASWHGHIAIMRGVEDGFSIVRAARGGYLTVSDDRGRILAETRSDSAPFATLVADVPVTHDATLYLRLGDWFAWLAFVILVFTLGRLCRLYMVQSGAHPS